MLRRPTAVLAAVACAILVLDQTSKHLVRATMSPSAPPIRLVGGLLQLTYVRNTGAAFGMFPGQPVMFATVSVIVLAGIAIYWWRVRPTRGLLVIALGLLAGGSAGNLIDRVTVGRVTDFLVLPLIPVFNVADMAILGGVGLLMWWLLFGPASHEAAVGAPETSLSAGDPAGGDPVAPAGGGPDRPAAQD